MLETPCRIISPTPTWEFLKEGDTIEIIAPSAAPLKPEQLEAAQGLIHQHGLKAFVAEGMLNSKVTPYSYYANSHEERAKNLIDSISGPSKVLWALIGGFGAAEVVEILERRSFVPPAHPKLILGFSDITALHLLADRWGWLSLHGPVVGFGKELVSVTQEEVNKEVNLSAVIKILKSELSELEYEFEVIHPGSSPIEIPILGSVMGGNLSIIENHSGTKTALQGDGRFVFFEDTPEDGKRIHRRLMNIVRTGVFNQTKGIIVGSNPIIKFEESEEEMKNLIKNFVHQVLLPKNINIPVIYSSRFGHGAYNDILPLGTAASLTVKVSVNESAYKS